MATTPGGVPINPSTGLPTVTITSPVNVGQSIGGAGTNSNLNAQNFDIASISPNGPNPARALDGPNPNAATTIYRFPSDTPPYYMMLPINDYSRASWVSVGVLNEKSRIILPMPQAMIDNHNVRYDISDLGIAGAVGFDAAGGQVAQAASLAAVGATMQALQTGTGQFGAAGAAVNKAVGGSLAAAGIAVNSFMTVMLKGPDYKKRDFVWRFSPKTAQETSDLRRIIQLINNSMAPSLFGIGSAFFTWPKIWKPEFVYNARPDLLALNTFKMKASVLTDASFNYTPNGVFSPFASTKAPSSVEMRLSFLELEYWLAGDFNDNGQATQSTGSTSQTLNNILTGNTTAITQYYTGVGTPSVAP